jgi:hypothetical protein
MPLIILANKFAPAPKPGKFFGQAVTIFHLILVPACATPGASTALPAAKAPTLALLIKSRLFIFNHRVIN